MNNVIDNTDNTIQFIFQSLEDAIHLGY